MDLAIDLGAHVPRLIRLQRLPLEFWNNEVFKDITKSFGSLLVVDKVNQTKACFLFARIYVSVTINQGLSLELTIESKMGFTSHSCTLKKYICSK